MCVANFCREIPQKRALPPPSPPPRRYSQIFREYYAVNSTVQSRLLVMQRIVQDPFYTLMNTSSASRIWMLRFLKNLVLFAEERYRVNMLQFFEQMRREDVLNFFRYKDAPREMIELWGRLHPVDGNGSTSTSTSTSTAE